MSPVPRLARVLVTPFAAEIVRTDLPGLPAHQVDDAIAFVVHRVVTMPTVLRLGLLVVAGSIAPLMMSPCRAATLRAVRRLHPPLYGEYLRLVRGLLVSRVWEQAPATRLGATA